MTWRDRAVAPDAPWKSRAVADEDQSSSFLPHGESGGEFLPGSMPFPNFAKGMATNEPAQGVGGFIGRGLPSQLGYSLAGPIGGALGEASRQALVTGMNPQNPPSPFSIGANTMLAGMAPAGIEAASPIVGPPLKAFAKGVAKGIGKAGGAVVDYGATNLAGIAKPAWEYTKKNAALVFSKAMNDPEAAGNFADAFKAAVDTAVDAGKAAYKKSIDLVRSDAKYGPGFRLNALEGVGKDLSDIGHEAGYIGPNRLENTSQAQEFMKNVLGQRLAKLQNATPEEMYFFQKDLNSLARDNFGTALGVAYNKASKVVGGFLANKVPEIGEGGAAYRAAMELRDLAKTFTTKDELAGYVKNLYAKANVPEKLKQLELVRSIVPEADAAAEGMRAADAARAVSPLFRGLPQNGMGAAIGYGLGALAKTSFTNPLTIPPAIAGAALASPRFYGALAQGAQAVAPMLSGAAKIIPQAAEQFAPQAAIEAGTILQQYYPK